MVAGKANFDVIVIGAGPSGCAAAIQCAQSGHKVALLEREVFPRHRPGETLHPGIEPLLRQLGLDSALHAGDFIRHHGNWVQWPSELRFQAFGSDANGQWRGFQAWRATFDALMLDRARQLGVSIQQPCKVREPILCGTRVIGVQTSSGPLTGRFVIDGSGSRHWLARKLSLAMRCYSPRLIVRFGYARGDCDARDDAPALVADMAGWTWTARVRPQLYQWTRLSWLPRSERDVVPDELRTLQPHSPARAADVTWRLVTEGAGPGYFLVGDAAAILDPLASHGVLKGLMSGMMAAHLINNSDKASQHEIAKIYCEWLRDSFESDVFRLRELYKCLPNCDWPLTWQSQHQTLGPLSHT
jgi:flavin-dependent dehydrogenase